MAELDSQSRSLQSLYSWFEEGKLTVNRRYQRKLVWTLEEKQKLVESVLNQYPVPAILLAEKDGEGYEIIDGLQRLHTLMSFIETGFTTADGAVFDVSRFATAQARADDGVFPVHSGQRALSAREVSTFLDYNMPVSVMRGAEEKEIDDVFARINTYGHRLSDQERRQAGVEDNFAELVRELACSVRGDVSNDVLDLAMMPSISIDLPMTRHGYDVVASDVFWVQQGILRSTDLRDSMDEQCIADVAASVIGGVILDRSKEALDAVYEENSTENLRISAALDTKGAEVYKKEFLYCISEVETICDSVGGKKLRNIIFDNVSTNPFPSVFAVIMIALHEALIDGNQKISDYASVGKSITGLYGRLETSRASTAPDERRKNIDTIKGLIAKFLIDAEGRDIYDDQNTIDIENAIRRSQVELAHYELKQGMLRLDDSRAIDGNAIQRVLKTICAIANNGKGRSGTILIGVCDKPSDVERVEELDQITPIPVGSARSVVGVRREAAVLDESIEAYVARWKTAIANSELSDPLKSGVLSSLGFNDFFGLGVLVISVPKQSQLSFFGEDVYWRKGDETVKADGNKMVAELAGRFS